MRVYEITVHGDKERIARLMCPDEWHAPPCEVPWSIAERDGAVVVAICATEAKAKEISARLGGTSTEADPGLHEALIEQARIELRL